MSSFGLGYVAATLLASGTGHAARLTSFLDLLRSHAVVPARLTPSVAMLVTLAELVAGSAALILLVSGVTDETALLVLYGGTFLFGLGFVAYLRRLSRDAGAGEECGCTPLAAPLTAASLLPGTALVLVAGTALVTTAWSARLPAEAVAGAPEVFPALWGVTLAALVVLVPATAPAPDAEGVGDRARIPAQLAS